MAGVDNKMQVQSGLRVQLQQSRNKTTTGKSFSEVAASGLSKAADAVMSAGQLAAPYIPGGSVLSAAMSGMGQLKNSIGGQGSGGGSNSLGLNSTGSTGGTTSSSGAFGAVQDQAAAGGEQAQLMLATKEMQEMNMSFNLQYLQLQQKMQSDNRQFTLMSNIMKTKHDTAKNAINNVR